jgi:hypothetical protein
LDPNVIFNESRNFNKETMVSRLDFGLEQMVLNQEPKMEDEKFPQYVQENPIMVEEDVNPSYIYILLMLMSPIIC